MLRSKPNSCSGCVLQAHGTDFSRVEGTGASGVLLVGESSGEHEAREQTPFVKWAPAGSVLERCIQRMGLRRDAYTLTNVCRCRPRNNWLDGAPWEYAALNHCRPNLDAVIAQYRPRCIVALGGIALRELTGMAGEKLGISYLAGYPLQLLSRRTLPADSICGMCEHWPDKSTCMHCRGTGRVSFVQVQAVHQDIPVIGDFHPAFLRRGKASHQGVFMRILQRALNIAAGKDHEWLWGVEPDDPKTWGGLRYITHPSLDQVNSLYLYLKDNPQLYISKDIETPESASMDEDAREGFRDTEVRQIQFACGKGTGMAIQWQDVAQREIAIKILNLPNPSYGHNWDNFDHKVLRAAAAREGWNYAPTTRVYDTLDMFHHWQPDLPAHLQFASLFVQFPFPWKHLHTLEFEPFYGCCDVDSTWQLGEFTQAKLKEEGIWGDHIRGYYGQLYEVRPVLAAMEDRGVPIDNEARLKLGAEFDAAQRELGMELLGKFPEEAKRPEPYKTFPPELKKLPESEWSKLFQEADKWRCKCKKDISLKTLVCASCGQTQEDGRLKAGKWYRYSQREVDITVGIDAQDKPITEKAVRWCFIPEFNPNSSKQVLEYMKTKGHPIPKNKRAEDEEGNNPDTTNKKELQRLAHKTGDTFYLKVIEYRELGKMLGTYIGGFAPQEDGRVHTTFTFDTGTGQLTSRNPNTQNTPSRARLADAFGRVIACSSNLIITKWDYRAFHVLTTGFEAECADWMRMARLDMHSLVAGDFLKCWKAVDIMHESNESLLERFKWLKNDPVRLAVRNNQAKPADLGIGFGMKPRRLYQENLEHFKSEAEAKKFHLILRQAFDPVFVWQDRIVSKAHQDRMLRSKFGHIRRFYEVMRPDTKSGGWVHGDQAEEAVAFLPANHAHGHMREVKKELSRQGLDEKYGLMNEVHDAYWFCFLKSLLEDHLQEVAQVLRSPSQVLSHPILAPHGLWCDVEVKAGLNITDAKEIPLPKAGYGVLPLGMELPKLDFSVRPRQEAAQVAILV